MSYYRQEEKEIIIRIGKIYLILPEEDRCIAALCEGKLKYVYRALFSFQKRLEEKENKNGANEETYES